ncbi:amino acid ABC transporter permease [Leifsonia sp. McL0607]|uniref:amino acid ABC transporter permease n=1 Tax=Leifsonia sp. McL0607 TaxID=3415672 RepID=UPI003CED65CB
MSAVLFDAPGPRARRRNTLLGVVAAVLVVGVLAFIVWRFAVTGQFSSDKWRVFGFPLVQRSILQALGSTLLAFAYGAVLSLALGLLLAIGRLSARSWLRVTCTVVVELFRAVPLLILMMIVYYGLPPLGVTFITPLIAVVTGLTLYNGAVLAEVFRTGVQSVPRGQREAAEALGMRRGHVLWQILLPQATRAMLPVILAQFVVILKDTALGFIVTYQELLYYAKYLGSNFQYGAPLIPATIVVGTVYIGLCLVLSGASKLVERRLKGTRRTRPGTRVAVSSQHDDADREDAAR